MVVESYRDYVVGEEICENITNENKIPLSADIFPPLGQTTTIQRESEWSFMIEQDTIRLLRECDAGIQMGTSSIEQVLPRVNSQQLRQRLEDCKQEHQQLAREIQTLLDRYQDEGKSPNPMAKGMSWIKTNLMMAADASDQTIADLMTDGCNMGVKSLNKYLNQYQAADEKTKDITKRLINLEEKLTVDIRDFL